MFARNVSIRLKANSVAQFTKVMEDEIIPLLRKQKGFRDEIAFVAPDGKEAVGISLWDQKESADAYNREGYPQVLKAMSKVTEGTPQVHSYEVSNSTFHKIAVHVSV
jgi:hypothetical protein